MNGSNKKITSKEDQYEAKLKHRQLLNEIYQATGEAKLPGICEYLNDFFESSGPQNKVLVFGYHLAVLNGIEECCVKNKVYIHVFLFFSFPHSLFYCV
mmetsp:Transcript_28405/g.36740  ORF Transcript_28405/g.36740 Transcript_28405/m.36740 type:complete len:98 (-) Transcript_28405:615-908(-)